MVINYGVQKMSLHKTLILSLFSASILLSSLPAFAAVNSVKIARPTAVRNCFFECSDGVCSFYLVCSVPPAPSIVEIEPFDPRYLLFTFSAGDSEGYERAFNTCKNEAARVQ